MGIAAKIIIFISILLLFFNSHLKISYASTNSKNQILIINQVRGSECCDNGSIENLKTQVNASITNKVPATFVLRYDVLKDSKYVNYLIEKNKEHPDLIKLGIFLEITPSLAKDSGVKHRGNSTNWFSAENLYSIGYSDRDNSKMVDQVFELFKEKFGYYPDTISSWMIKTELINYLHDKYSVNLAEITREQWDVDSYTLYGGPPHYPYPASKNWILNPDYGASDSALIVRQTLTDPLYIYGDNSSSFTSQPNDYMRNKDFSYFKNLFAQAINQGSNPGFALIGLENSMEEKYQKEYVKQIELISKYKNDKKVSMPSSNDLISLWKNRKINIYSGSDLVKNTDNQAIWVSTPGYRIRIRQNDNKVFIDDIRVYSSKFKDPYSDKNSYRSGIWIIPFLLDGSIKNKSKNLFSFSPPKTDDKFTTVSSDVDDALAKIKLPNIKSGQKIKISENKITYTGDDNKNIDLSFSNDSVSLDNLNKQDLRYTPNKATNYPVKYESKQNGFNLNWDVNNKTWISANIACDDQSCKLKFADNASLTKSAVKDDYEFLLPQQSEHPLDERQTVLYPNNQYAIAGRNPVRLVFIPYDKYGIITNLKNGCNDIVVESSSVKCSQDDKRFFLDLYNDSPMVKKISVRIKNGDVNKNEMIYFAPNCKHEAKKCIKNPKYSWWYLNTIIGDKARTILNNEKN